MIQGARRVPALAVRGAPPPGVRAPAQKHGRAGPAVVALLACAACAGACGASVDGGPPRTFSANGIEIGDVVAAAPAAGSLAPLYFTLHNRSEHADTIIGITTDAAVRAEVHAPLQRRGMVAMQRAGPIAVPPGATIRLEPGGYHVMLTGLRVPLQPGQELMAEVLLRRAGAIRISARVVAYAALDSALDRTH